MIFLIKFLIKEILTLKQILILSFFPEDKKQRVNKIRTGGDGGLLCFMNLNGLLAAIN